MADEVERRSENSRLGSRSRAPSAGDGLARQVALAQERRAVLVRRARAQAVFERMKPPSAAPMTVESLTAPPRARARSPRGEVAPASVGEILRTLVARTGRRVRAILGRAPR